MLRLRTSMSYTGAKIGSVVVNGFLFVRQKMCFLAVFRTLICECDFRIVS